jgi:hypothetical protein
MLAQMAVGGRPRERLPEEEEEEGDVEGDVVSEVDLGFLLAWPSSVVDAGSLESSDDDDDDDEEEELPPPVTISVAFLGRKPEKCLMSSRGPRVLVRNVKRALS